MNLLNSDLQTKLCACVVLDAKWLINQFTELFCQPLFAACPFRPRSFDLRKFSPTLSFACKIIIPIQNLSTYILEYLMGRHSQAIWRNYLYGQFNLTCIPTSILLREQHILLNEYYTTYAMQYFPVILL